MFAQSDGQSVEYPRPRASDLGIRIGGLSSGEWNAITDVGDVRVGHTTVVHGDSIRTGVTAILPHGGNVFRDRVRAALVVGNGFGKLIGGTQLSELGELETPLLLTGTLNVWRVADALVDTLLASPGFESVRSINPVIGETNDGWLSDIRARPIGAAEVREALRNAVHGPVEEGSIGAGTGTRALGWKGGIGTSSRVLPDELGGFTVGVLVQSNFGGSLVVAGVPVGRILRDEADEEPREPADAAGGGSIMIIIATDAPLDHRGLERLGMRSFGGLARTGAALSHGSGDYAIAFTTDGDRPMTPGGRTLTALFGAVQAATEEAILNSMFRATTVKGFRGRRSEAIPIDRLREILGTR
ncbi:MAG: P1 family peptidase [marine benthic group bacterium]|nr:P1 family peptidase [Gemmatimonadota bacterium]